MCNGGMAFISEVGYQRAAAWWLLENSPVVVCVGLCNCSRHIFRVMMIGVHTFVFKYQRRATCNTGLLEAMLIQQQLLTEGCVCTYERLC